MNASRRMDKREEYSFVGEDKVRTRKSWRIVDIIFGENPTFVIGDESVEQKMDLKGGGR